MTVKSVLKLACYFLGLDEIAETNTFNTSGSTATTEQKKEIDTLVRCLNLVVQEIATNYVFVTNQKEISFKNGKISLNEIDENFLETISLTVNDRKIKFKEMMNSLFANVQNAIITYRKYPETLSMDDDCPNFNCKIAEKTIAYGVAMEYSFINSLSDEATIFENRYKQDLLTSMRKNSEKKLKCRRWL